MLFVSIICKYINLSFIFIEVKINNNYSLIKKLIIYKTGILFKNKIFCFLKYNKYLENKDE